MSVEIKTVEFERRSAYLSDEDEEEPPFTVHGVALGDDDVTVGQSGIKKLWPAEELRAAAETLEEKNLVEDHENGSRGVVGEVTKAGYKDGVGVIYEAELFDDDLADKINNGLLEVSIRGHHANVDSLEEDDESGALVVEDITFENLSVVPNGASESNTIEMGEADELSVATLSQYVDELQEDFEPEAGDYVKWGDSRGVVLTMPEDGEVEVDVYEESDGEWRPVGETEMVSVGSLEEWDADEDNIGPMEDEEDEESDEESDESEEEAEKSEGIPARFMFESEEDAMEFVEDEDGLTGAHEMDGVWMPGSDHDEFVDWWEDEEEMAHEVDGRGEGEEQPITSDEDKQDLIEQSPERYPDEETADELQEYSFHDPEWSGTTESDWSSPDMEDFDTDDLSEIADHFLISESGFPPENYSDLKLPVVEPNGDLNKNALAAVKGGRGVSAVESLSDNMESEITNWVNETANDEFDESWGEDEEEAAARVKRERTIDDTGDEPNVEDSGPVDISLDLINKYLRIEGNHERDSVDDMLAWLFGSTDLPMETLDDFRTASTAFLNQTPGTDSFDGMTVEQFRDWLLLHGDGSKGRREQGGGLPPGAPTPVRVLTGDDLQQGSNGESEMDSITTYTVTNMTEELEEQLEELDEPVAVEESDLEELREKADQFEEMNSSLEDLRERTEILDDVDREQVEELAEGEDPVVLESTRHEQLQDEAEQVKNVYAASLSETYDAFSAEELTDKFSIEELREKFEENIGDPEEELAADPKSGDPDEEELEDQAQEESEETEELSGEEKEAQEKRDELRDKILSGGR